jgi:cell division septation protein DedD
LPPPSDGHSLAARDLLAASDVEFTPPLVEETPNHALVSVGEEDTPQTLTGVETNTGEGIASHGSGSGSEKAAVEAKVESLSPLVVAESSSSAHTRSVVAQRHSRQYAELNPMIAKKPKLPPLVSATLPFIDS